MIGVTLLLIITLVIILLVKLRRERAVPQPSRATFAGNNLDYKFLVEAASQLAILTKKQEVFDYINTALTNLLPENVVVLIVKAVDDGAYLELLSILGFEETILYKGIKLLGFNLIGKKYVITNDFKNHYCRPVLHHIEGGLFEFSANEIPKSIADQAERMLDIQNIFTIGIAENGNYFGYIHFLIRGTDVEINKPLIESFVYQCYLALSNISAMQQVVQSEAKFRALIENLHAGVVVHRPDTSLGAKEPANASHCQLYRYY